MTRPGSSQGLPDLYVAGPPRHGVVRYAQDLAHAVSATGDSAHLVSAPAGIRRGHPLHLHFTDRLFGDSPEEAAAEFERLTTVAPITVTLHDVPQPSDGVVNLPRRVDCYRRVLLAAAGAICNSAHERLFLHEVGVLTGTADPTVIPLAVEEPSHRPVATRSAALEPVAALIGFVYPGKGHLEVIESMARIARSLDVVALGAPSAGHEADVVTLSSTARQRGLTFSATGFLSDDELIRRCETVAVPLAAHQHISASGSILTWLSAGRRPLVLESRYSREMLALRPDTMTLFSADGMDAAILRALEDPASTMLAPGVSTAPHLAEVVDGYRRFWREVVA